MNSPQTSIPVPARLAGRPRDHRGFIIPFFVAWLDDNGAAVPEGKGTPDFRVIHPGRIATCVRQNLCWLCGKPLGRHKVFTMGPMCATTRTVGEPPSHLDCAEYAVKVCPFLSKPRMRRDVKDLPEHRVPAPGEHLDRNPGGMALWVTPTYKLFRPQMGNQTGMLITVGEPTAVHWYREGRPATRDEVIELLASGMPILQEKAERDGPDAVAALAMYAERVKLYLPA
jgi:hypothetical protein